MVLPLETEGDKIAGGCVSLITGEVVVGGGADLSPDIYTVGAERWDWDVEGWTFLSAQTSVTSNPERVSRDWYDCPYIMLRLLHWRVSPQTCSWQHEMLKHTLLQHMQNISQQNRKRCITPPPTPSGFRHYEAPEVRL